MMLYPASLLIEKVVSQGDWFWPFAPDIDENGLADFSKLEAAGKIIEEAEEIFDSINPDILLPLAAHIAFAAKREKEKISWRSSSLNRTIATLCNFYIIEALLKP